MQPTARPRPRGQALGREPAREDDSAGELTDKIAISLSDSVGWRHSLNSNPEETKALSTKNFREFASRIEDAGAPFKRHWLVLFLKAHNSSLRGYFLRSLHVALRRHERMKKGMEFKL